MTKNARQEITFVLGGKSYTVRPDFAYINRLETAMGTPARLLGLKCLNTGSQLAMAGQAQEVTMVEMASIIWGAIGGTKDAPKTFNELGEILMDDGYGDYLQPFGNMLANCLNGHKDHSVDAPKDEVAPGVVDPSNQDQSEPLNA